VAGPNPLVQLSLGKIREFLREPEAVFWVFIFPVLLTLALGIAFRSRGPEPLAVAVEDGAGAAHALAALAAEPGLKARLVTPEESRQELRTGRVALIVIPGDPPTYWHDATREESRTAKLLVDSALQRGAGRADRFEPAERLMTEKGSRYIDFLVPGLLGMNLMGTGMWGIGFSIVNSRSRKLLKRLGATPMRRSDFLLAQMIGRMVFLILEVTVLLAFAYWAFDVPIRGSLLVLALVAVLSALAFSGLGLLVASRARTIEGVSGLMNLVMLPMWLLSGTFFSTARFPDALQPLVRALPLTAVNNALRAVILDGAGLTALSGDLLIVAGWALAAFTAALILFRWR